MNESSIIVTDIYESKSAAISATMPAFQITVVELFFCSPSDEQRGSQQNEGGGVGKMSSISSQFPRLRSFHSVWPIAASEIRRLKT